MYLMGLKAPDFAQADNPAASAASPLTRTLTFLFLPVVNFALLLCPRWLSFDWYAAASPCPTNRSLFRSMDAIPLVTTLTDCRNGCSLLLYSMLFLLVRLTLPRSASLCASCLCSPSSPASPKLKSRGSAKWNNNNAVSFYSRDLLWIKSNESDEEGDAETRRDANEPLLMAITLMIFPWLPASNLFFYVGFVVAGQSLLQQFVLLIHLVPPQNAFCTFHRWDSACSLRPEWRL